MIARIWRGVTRESDKDTYFEYLQQTGLKEYAAIAGNQGVWVLRRVSGGKAEFTLISLWETWDAIKAFAGPTTKELSIIPRTRNSCSRCSRRSCITRYSIRRRDESLPEALLMIRSPGPPGTLLRSVVWRSLAAQGSDYCSLWQMAQGWLLKGTAVAVLTDGRPMLADYEIHCDRLWHTRRVAVECVMAAATRSVNLTVDSPGEWLSSGEELSRLRECIDTDLAVTPATNTLPIRRLSLEIGQCRDGFAAWLKFPDLTLEILSQRYTRLDVDRYLYQSASGFSAELVVDDLGLVTSYPGGWERVASL